MKTYFPALTGLRAGAAYLVFLHHYNPIEEPNWLHQLIDQGYVGVSVFFVLSGFLIYHRYVDLYKSPAWSWRVYLQHRFVRIGPLYFLILLLTMVVSLAQNHPISGPDFFLNLTLIKGFSETYMFSGIPQSWSLTVELCFYLVAPLLFRFVLRRHPIRIVIILLVVGLTLRYTIGSLSWYGLFGSLNLVFFYTFFGRSFEFIAGMWLAQNWQRLPYRHSTCTGILTMIFCMVVQTFIVSSYQQPNVVILSELILYNGLFPIGISLFLLGLIREKTFLSKALSTQLFQALGKSSYAFYLIHIGVIAKTLQQVSITNIGLLWLLLILLAYGLYVLIEKPLQKHLHTKRIE